MIALLKRNLSNFITKKWYFLLVLFFQVFFLFFYLKTERFSNLYYLLNGADTSNWNFLTLSLGFVVNLMFLYYANSFYQYDMMKNKEMVFLRISYEKWMASQLLTNSLFIAMILLFFTCLYFLYGFFFEIALPFHLAMFLVVYLTKLCFVQLYLLLAKFLNHFSILILIILMIIPAMFFVPTLLYVTAFIEVLSYFPFILLLVLFNLCLMFLNLKTKDSNLYIKKRRISK